MLIVGARFSILQRSSETSHAWNGEGTSQAWYEKCHTYMEYKYKAQIDLYKQQTRGTAAQAHTSLLLSSRGAALPGPPRSGGWAGPNS